MDSTLMRPPPPRSSNSKSPVSDNGSPQTPVAFNIQVSDSAASHPVMQPPNGLKSSSFLSPLSAHSARPPTTKQKIPGVSFGPVSVTTISSADSSSDDEDTQLSVFPLPNGPQFAGSTAPGIPRSRKKVALEPGHSALDWARLKSSGADLRGGVRQLQRYTPSELAQHKSKEDLWMAIQGKVYNVTPYLKFHPGGVGQLMRGAGKDATELYMKVHPWVNVDLLLDKCHIGFLVPESYKNEQKQ